MRKNSAKYANLIAATLLTSLAFGISTAQTPVQARDTNSQKQDIAITNACIQSGGAKAQCVCTASILKYEMTFWEYEAASKLYAAEKNKQTSQLSATKMALVQRGYSEAELTAIDRYRRQLLKPDSFEAKCQTAKAYFSQS